jgi:ABC-type branched-subunit amino acid transport system substrate-binding protein
MARFSLRFRKDAHKAKRIMFRCRILAYLLILLCIVGCATKKAPEPIWLGHLVPLTGTNRTQGEEAVGAMQTLLQTARENDWQVGGRSVGVRHADASGGRARGEAVRLLAVNRVVGLIAGPGLADAEEVAAEARTHEAAVILLDEVAEVSPGPAVVALGPDPARRGRGLAQLARTQWKMPLVAVLLDRRDRISATLAGAFESAWRQTGGSLREWSVADKTELPGVKADLARFKPEVVLVSTPVARLRELADWLPRVPILFGGPDDDEEVLLRDATALSVGSAVYAATAFTSAAVLSTEGKVWQKRFEKSQRKPPDRSAVLACDGLRLMMSALAQTNPKGPAPLRTQLREELSRISEFDSVTGKVVWKDQQPVRPLFLVRFQAGKPTILATVTGDES